MSDKSQAGFTVIELLVVMFLLSIVTVGFYQVMFQTTRGSETAGDIADISQEARLGFNRMVRDTREGRFPEIGIPIPTITSFTVEIDFDGDGDINPTPDPSGSYEKLTFTWDQATRTITASNGVSTEVLMDGVDCIRKPNGSCHDVFTYTSSRLELDTNGDGVTSAVELDNSSVGNKNGTLDGGEVELVNAVTFSLTVTKGDRSTNFYAEAQMRNVR